MLRPVPGFHDGNRVWLRLAGNLVLGAVILVLVAGIILDIRKRKK